ncbi:MAG: alpha/beta hydrolase [Rhodanobacteraceae bacterium]|nr:MAG: alpha/beta hydrolase [Rhodanobacteraceae bacterium]
MKSWMVLPCLLFACGSLQAKVWQPSAGHTQIPLWPGTPPGVQPVPGSETETLRTDRLIAGRPWTAVTNVSRPTLTVYPPKGKNTGAAVVVFPGGGFQVLAIDLEGTEVCRWLTSIGVTCVLLKYRVPSAPYDWECKCYDHGVLAASLPSLQDAQRAIRLVRFHAAKWHVDPHKIGVIGFSAGGFLVAETSADFNRRMYRPVGPADEESDRPDFAIAIYPGHITLGHGLNKNLHFTHETPPTFVLQAEDAKTDQVRQSLVYYAALAKAGVPAELHIYAKGGHAFGLRPTQLPITHWPKLAEAWLHTIGVLPPQGTGESP